MSKLTRPSERGRAVEYKSPDGLYTGVTLAAMPVLVFLMNSFINAFGITRPRPEQERTVALALGGSLLVFGIAMVSLLLWMLFGTHR